MQGDQAMKIALILALALISFASAAWAACPAGTRYECYQGYNGKVICACR
jgi:hypothetical protein